jgi:hypothetical protein
LSHAYVKSVTTDGGVTTVTVDRMIREEATDAPSGAQMRFNDVTSSSASLR